MDNQLLAVRPGIILAMLVLMFGITMGMGFGLNEDGFKDHIQSGIDAHPQLHDQKSPGKIWRYAQRAHFHATGIGAFTLALIMVTAFTSMKDRLKTITSTLIGMGGFYSLAWYTQFLLAPDLGRHAAHEAFITKLIVDVSIAALLAGMLMLFAHLLFGFGHAPGRTDAATAQHP